MIVSRAILMLGCVVALGAGGTDSRELSGLLEEYFTRGTGRAPAAIVADIEAVPGTTASRVAEALQHLQLWEAVEPGLHELELPNEQDGATRVIVRVPTGYDAARRWPVLIALHGTNGRAQEMLAFAGQLLGRRADEFLIAAPQDIRGDDFHDPPADAGQPIDLLVRLRQEFHVDSDRVYLTGYSLGGHGTLLICLMHADLYAAGIPMAGTLLVPRRRLLYPAVLPNLSHVPILLCWGADDVLGPDGQPSPVGGMAGENDRLAATAKRMGLPLEAVELPGVGHGGVRPPAALFERFTSRVRVRYPREVTHRFRYPAQGHAYWLRVRKFAGKPWTGGELPPITLRQGDNPEQRVTQEVVDRLALISGKIEGQRIELDTQRVARLEVLLSDEMLELAEPVTVVVRGEMRFEGLVQRRIAVLLEEAARTWDFQRLFSARLVVKGSGKVSEAP